MIAPSYSPLGAFDFSNGWLGSSSEERTKRAPSESARLGNNHRHDSTRADGPGHQGHRTTRLRAFDFSNDDAVATDVDDADLVSSVDKTTIGYDVNVLVREDRFARGAQR